MRNLVPRPIHSAIFIGWVRHRRFLPVEHSFRYRMFMMYLDLDELPGLFTGRWLWSASRRNLAWFRREDYLGDASQPLKTAIHELVERETGHQPRGAIRLLTHMRYFGTCFNPVSFYYCFEADGQTLQTIVADINNTPWGERHAYVLDCTRSGAETASASLKRFQFGKDFHVSPFMPMDMEYDWTFSHPQEQLSAHMRNLKSDRDHNVKMFDATLDLKRREITGVTLAWALLAYPFMTLKVILAIYWQALRLWLKRVPLHTHPQKLSPSNQLAAPERAQEKPL